MENLILITGNDLLAVKNKADSIINEIKKKITDEYSFETIAGDAENSKPMKVLEELSAATGRRILLTLYGDTARNGTAGE